MKKKLSIILLLCFLTLSNIWGSTIFCLQKEESLLLSKTTGWSSGFGYIIINQRNIQKKAFRIGFTKRAKWISKYGSITFNQVAQDMPSGGINEKGLVIEVTSNSRNISIKSNSPKLSEVQWVQYQLDNFSTVNEVLLNIEKNHIKQLGKGLSYFLCDKSGNKAVVEIFNGKISVIKQPILPILTNTPYKKALNFLNNINGQYKNSNPQSSINRFISSSNIIKNFQNSNLSDIDYAFKNMQKVKQGNTVWNIVYDIKKMKIYFKTKKNKDLRYIDMSKVNFEQNLSIEINYPVYGDITDNLIKYDIDKNKELVNNAYQTLVKEGSIKGVYKIFVRLLFTDRLKKYPKTFKPNQTP